MSNDKISLRMPASAEYGRVARAAAANLATRLEWQAVDIDSLRMAIDHAFAVLTGGEDSGDIEVEFEIIPQGIELAITAKGPGLAPIPAERVNEFTRHASQFASATVDEAAHHVRITKRV